MAELHDITAVLNRLGAGAVEDSEGLFAQVYAELRRIARAHLSRERVDHTLRPTDLVHEAYLRLVDQTRCHLKGRAHFLSIASCAMRRVLVDHARGRARHKRDGGRRISLDEAVAIGSADADTTLLALDVALARLSVRHPDRARVVEMHFFGGLNYDECAAVLDISPRTISRYWEYAKAWLYREMTVGSLGS